MGANNVAMCSFLISRAININCYTNAKLQDIHYIYGLANGNGSADVQLYGERYPTWCQPNHQIFSRVHQNLAEHESISAIIEGTGRPQRTRMPIFEEGVLYGRKSSVRTIAH